MRKYIGSVLLFLLVACAAFAQSTLPATTIGGKYIAANYGSWFTQSVNSVAAGAGTMTLNNCYPKLGNATNIRPIFPIAVDVPVTIVDGSLTETALAVTAITAPTANTASSINPFSCSFTATFANAHNGGVTIISGDNGLAEAINDAHATGGVVVVDPSSGITTAQMIASTALYHNVSLEDVRLGSPQFWALTPATTTTLAAPTTLTAVTALPSATPVGAYGTGTYHLAIAYVDAMGNEGQPSADFSEAGLATGSFIFSAPAASTGAVGYTIYISLTAGTYALSYKVPLTSSICTLTSVETVTAACAVANTTYGQSGATATVTAITVNTARLWVGLGGTSTTADIVGNSNARTIYAYAASNHVGLPGVVAASTAFAGATAPATTVPAILGTVTLPAGFMNQVGKTIRVCGLFTEASAGSTSTITQVNFVWDADGSNTTGAGVLLGGPKTTSTLPGSAADQWYFCQNFKTTVAGAAVTAGSIQAGAGFLSETSGSVGTATAVGWGNAPTIGAATVGSLNLAGEARIDIDYIHTTGTDGAAPTLTDLTVEVVN